VVSLRESPSWGERWIPGEAKVLQQWRCAALTFHVSCCIGDVCVRALYTADGIVVDWSSSEVPDKGLGARGAG
jgi:hypothetical protein